MVIQGMVYYCYTHIIDPESPEDHEFRVETIIFQPLAGSMFIPRSSMYGIFTYIWVICGVNVGKYTSTMDDLGFTGAERCLLQNVMFMEHDAPGTGPKTARSSTGDVPLLNVKNWDG